MRNLTIKREKRFVGCAGKFKVYIEDPESNELVINYTPCRKIGELKNGEEKTFQIDERAAKVFVIADKLTKDYCNDYYQLSYGTEDVFLSGKSKFNPAAGNAFRFDNNNSEGVVANRKRGKRKGLTILLIAIIIGAIVGAVIGWGVFSNIKAEEKTFYSDGMTITLTDEFRKTEIENYTVAYDSQKVAVFALKEPFSAFYLPSSYTLEQYGNKVIEANGFTSIELKETDGLTYFSYKYTNSQTRQEYTYFAFVYKANDAFWLVQFATLTKNVNKYWEKIFDWAGSIEFTN
ncbi:MAG: hypothetical protein E7350_04910 [Clostridiales bacterium]|nr:hypothetical protein [Clostridiales bacterium]